MYPQHHRFQVWSTAQHPYKHSLAELTFTNPALPTDEPQNAESALNWLFAVIYPQTQPSVADPASLPLAGNTLNDYRVVLDDGDGKAAAYRWEQREGDVAAKWYKIYDMDWGEQSILSNFLLQTQDVYVYKHGIDDLDDAGVALTGIDAGQSIYGGQSANTHLSLYANSGDGVGPGTGFVQVGDDFRPKTDNVYTSGTATERWSHVYTMLATVNTMSIASGSITDTTGALDFGDEDLSTTGTVTVNTMLIASGSITDTTGDINFGDEDLTTTGNVTATRGDFGTMYMFGDYISASGDINIITADGSGSTNDMVLRAGDISILANNTGGLLFLSGATIEANSLNPAGVFTFNGNLQIHDNTISTTDVDSNIVLAPNGAGIVDIQSAITSLQLDVDNLRLDGNTLSSTNTDGDVNVDPDGTGTVIIHSSLTPNVDDTHSLGTAVLRWDDLFLSNSIGDGTTAITTSTLLSLRDINSGASPGDTIFWDGTKWNPSNPDTEIDHGTISGLGDDDHTQYALLAGRAGGQTLTGGTASAQTLTLQSTSDATKGSVIFVGTLRPNNDDTYDIGTSLVRVRNLYMSGEGIGFRLENAADFASLPAPSVSSKGRVAWVDNVNTLYVDDGGVWVAAATVPGGGVWSKYSYDYTDFNAATATTSVNALTLPALDTIEAIVVKHTTAFAGTGVTTVNVSVGTISDRDEYTIDHDVFQATGDTVFQATNILTPISFAADDVYFYVAANVNTDQLTQGAFDVYVKTSSLPA